MAHKVPLKAIANQTTCKTRECFHPGSVCFRGIFMPLNRYFDSLSFYGFGIHHTLWRPCDSMAKKKHTPNHLRRVFWRLSHCLRVIRINRESLGIFMWYLDKTQGQIKGMTNRKSNRFQPYNAPATTENSGFAVRSDSQSFQKWLARLRISPSIRRAARR